MQYRNGCFDMVDKSCGEAKAETSSNRIKKSKKSQSPDDDDVDVVSKKSAPSMARGLDSLPTGFNRIETSTFDLLANQDGFVTRESLKKAAQNPDLDEVQKDDVQHMLKNFKYLTKEFDDSDGGKFGISREDIAKYDFTADVNHVESSTVDKLDKASDGSITREALSAGLERQDLSDYERDDIEYLQRQFTNIRALSPDGDPNCQGISMADIAASNARVEQYVARFSGAGSWSLIDRYNVQPKLDEVENGP